VLEPTELREEFRRISNEMYKLYSGAVK